ncbi:CPBP family intramembrane glutamic endopeptidase [Kordiimonas aquimaris]|uniref:CPBP family intramembrane glutamic endopeptidase n=1 Tax=Kordiimonas aquimaris TaxID=707591 RepID=UPI0021CE4934|nr:type II CAAX endopeptidase family protein [Kordiimonas aquimaris]
MDIENLTRYEIGLTVMIALAMPVISYLFHLRDKREREQGIPFDRISSYGQTLAFLWIPALILLGYWFLAGRDFDLLGMIEGGGVATVSAWGAVAVIGILLGVQVWAAHAKPSFAQKTVEQLSDHESTSRILPQNKRELMLFFLLSISAGITEEVMFRGFLIWIFEHWMPLWAAAFVALLSFTAAHLYQESASLIARVFLAGLVFTVVYLWAGSLWPAIVLHALVDIAAGATIYLARQTVERENNQRELHNTSLTRA